MPDTSSDESRSAAFNTVGRTATKEASSRPYEEGLHRTEIGIQTGPEDHATATVEHGFIYPTRPDLFREGRTDNIHYEPFERDKNGVENPQSVLFNYRKPEITNWHSTTGNKIGAATVLGAAVDFAKKQSGGQLPDVSGVRTKNSNDAYNRIMGENTKPTFMEESKQDSLDSYGDLTAGIEGKALENAEQGNYDRYGKRYEGVPIRRLSSEDLGSARHTAANLKKIAAGQPYRSYQDVQAGIEAKKAEKEANAKESRKAAFEAAQVPIEGL